MQTYRSVINSTHALIHNALNYAVYPAQLISSNPTMYIKIPKNVVKRHIITPEQFAALCEKYPFGTPFHIPLLLLYHTGMQSATLYWVNFSVGKLGNVSRSSLTNTLTREKTALKRLDFF